MTRRITAVLLACLVLGAAVLPAAAESGRLYTASCFAGSDPSALPYALLLRGFEEETGWQVIDDSMESSEAWKRRIRDDFAAGSEPDVLFFFAAGADSAPLLNWMVPLDEINAAYPDARLPEDEVFREADGHVYAVPVRPYWEGLFVNTELFERYSVPLPTDRESLLAAVRALREAGVVPLAASLTDVPHYIAELAILACATPEEQQARPRSFEEVPASWLEGMAFIRELYLAGAFPDNAATADEASVTALFREGKAAMKVDGSWFAGTLTEEEMARTAVLPVAAGDGAPPYIGGVSMGFYLTRRAWERPGVRDMAVRLLTRLAGDDSREQLSGITLTGRLRESAAELTGSGRQMLRPIQDDMNADARELWLLGCIAAVAEGRMTPETCWRQVMALQPFGQ